MAASPNKIVSAFVFLTSCGLMTSNNVPGKLIMVHIVYRHGDRSSVASYPNNPFKESAWPQGYGQLSQKGMEQHYKLGQYFRNRYVEEKKLLSKEYKRNEFHIESSDYDRTLMSAYSNLAGWYPPGNSSQEWNKDIPWQPIPVHTRPRTKDFELSLDAPCPRYDQLYQLELKSDRIKKEEKENKDFYHFIANVTGVSNENISNIWKIYDTLFCQWNHLDLGFKMPNWVNKTFDSITVFEKLAFLDSFQFDVMFDDPVRSRLKGGPLLKVMVEQMKSKVNGSFSPNEKKAFVYSAHDSTVSALNCALKVFNKKMPPYASAVMIELYIDAGKWSVQILFKNGTGEENVHPLTIPGCENPCPFDTFLNLTKLSIPDDIEKECRISQGAVSNRLALIVGSSCGLLGLLVIVFITLLVCKRRQQAQHNYSGIQTTA